MGAAIASVGAYGAVAALRFGELRAMGVHWPWKRLRGAWSAGLVALVPALVLREVLPGRSGAALAVLAFFSVFVWGVVRWAFDEGDRETFSAVVPSLARPRPRPVPPVVPEATGLTAILVVSSENDGGAARSTFLLARDLRRFGVRPIVALHREGDLSRRLAAAGIAFEVVPGLPEDLTRRPGRPDSLWAVPGNVRALPRAVAYLRDLAAREAASVFYGQVTWAHIVSAFAARGTGVATVWHIRNDFQQPVKRLVMRAVARACGVRAIVAVSRSAGAPLEELPAPLHVVHNGADLAACDAARNAPDDLRRRLGITENAVVACYAGRLLPHKGIHVLMEAARRAMSRNPSLELVILGGNPAKAARDVLGELSHQAASWGLAHRIHLPGWIPDVERALVGFDVAVIPSTCRECCSRSLIESLCLGLPVVASHVGGNPELVRHGEDGLLVTAGDPERLAQALVALASDARLRRRLAIGALTARRRFDSVSVAERVAAILKKAAAHDARVGEGQPCELMSAGE
jgi:glycosyltransferase involved in cell wall biosynthesis